MEPTPDTTVRTSLDKEPAARPGPVLPTDSAAPTGFRMHRSRTDRMLGGVCGGLAESLGVDAALLRIGLVVLTLLGAGIGVLAYLAAWVLVPEADPDR